MKAVLQNIFLSLPVQLFILHFRKYQSLLIFWYLLFITIDSSFLKTFGADAIFLSPEYLGSVNMRGAFITGLAFGVFIMSWNITTFILHSKKLKFLATTTNPFLKYCFNNGLLPLLFLLFYLIKLYYFNQDKELMSATEISGLIFGILSGITLLILFSFVYFFGAGRSIERSMLPVIRNPLMFNKTFTGKENIQDDYALKVRWYLSTGFQPRKCRNVSHYRQDFLDAIFKRHHIAGMVCILIAFCLLVTTGFLLDYKVFEMPAAASIFIVFALLISLIGALAYFLQTWSLPVVIILLGMINFLYQKKIIDPRNKAYGLNYNTVSNRPSYNKTALQMLCSTEKMMSDRANMLQILNNWKLKQTSEKPVMVFINVSGGGLRSAAFTMNALQQTDSLTGGNLMKKTFLISGASGGMLAAAYYRELYRNKAADSSLNIYSSRYTDNISGDLLNPVFTSLMARDILAPVQKFSSGGYKYLKDRGYAFEKKLGDNTEGLLNKQLADLKADDHSAKVPLIIFNSVIKSDARKMMISTQPVSFMMKPYEAIPDSSASPDAVDYSALFKDLSPLNLRLLTALRMNATFPYVLPNVWLPSEPVIDVMDAGMRDNYGQETTLRFIDNFKDWLQANTGGILIIDIRDRRNDNWQQPFETKSVTDMFVTPATMLQHNWFKLQDYYQADQFRYFKNYAGLQISKATVMYMPEKEEKTAALNFHLSARERRDVVFSFKNNANQQAVKYIAEFIR